LILSVAFLPAVGSLAGPDQPAAAPSVPADESDRPLYAPPKKLIPRARVGGEMRGTDGADPEVQPLAPDHVGFTTDRTPTVNWFLSKPTSHKIVFTFTDSRVIRPLYEAQIPTPKSAGIQSVHLKDLGLILETEVQYRWYVSVQRDPDSPSRDIVAGGVIERCDIGECLTTGAVLSCDQHAVVENARNGLWYDAMACLCSLIDRAPADHSLRKLRARLLQDVGLPGVAEWDLRAIQSMNR
jgi:hypothetical protein